MRNGGKCLSLPPFLSFLPFLNLIQSVSFCTKAGGLVMMRGIIYKNLINIISPPFLNLSVSFHSPLPSCTMGPSFPLYQLRFPLVWPSVTCFSHATPPCHASPGTPQRARDIPPGCFFSPRESLGERMALTYKKHHSPLCHVWTRFCCSTWQKFLGQAETGSTNATYLKFPS